MTAPDPFRTIVFNSSGYSMQLGRALLFSSAIFLAAAFLALNFMFGIGPNFGWHIGYYGKLNRIVDTLREIPDLKIEEVGMHEDATLEDFQVTVIVKDGRQTIYFDNANIRSFDDLAAEIENAL